MLLEKPKINRFSHLLVIPISQFFSRGEKNQITNLPPLGFFHLYPDYATKELWLVRDAVQGNPTLRDHKSYIRGIPKNTLNNFEDQTRQKVAVFHE